MNITLITSAPVIAKARQEILVKQRHTETKSSVAARGGSSPSLKGGAIWRGGARKKMKSERAEVARKFFGLRSTKLSGFSSEERLCLRISPHSKRDTEKRVHLGQDKGRFSCQKGAPKLSFHREAGGQLPPFALP